MDSSTLSGIDLRVLVTSDTHVRTGRRRRLPPTLLEAAATADAVVHGGDVTSPEVLDQLGELAPLYAVLGNNDGELTGRLPVHLEVVVGSVAVAVVHDSGPSTGRSARLKRLFPDADLVIFGHSHQSYSAPGHDGQWLLNPGSPTERRRAPTRTMAWVQVIDGRLQTPTIVDLGP